MTDATAPAQPDPARAAATAAPPRRMVALDLARSAALLAMAVFHFAFDLEMFGWLAPGTTVTGGWRLLALCTAGSFLFLAGISLWLAHGGDARWPAFGRRFLRIAGAAALISAATYVAMPDVFIFFGILHATAAASLVGMACLCLPVPVLLGLAALAVSAPHWARADMFNAWPLWWTGLHTGPLASVDYVPLAPWLGPFLLGLAAGKLGTRAGLWARLGHWQAPALARRLAWPGRHSLLIYLAHQPVLVALVWSASLLLR